MRRLLACAVALAGLLGLEMQAGPATRHPEDPGLLDLPTTPVPEAAAIRQPGASALAVERILARPLFTSGRRPNPPEETAVQPPRLAGLVLAPSMRLALLQMHEADGARPVPVGPGGEVSGWRVVRIDATGVLVRRGGQRLQLAIRQAGARPLPPTPIDQVVLMPEKRTNPQLAW